MDKQNVVLKTHELEVVGYGGMIYAPCQIGEWWVMPAEMYAGTIPEDIMKKWDNFKVLNIPVLGYLIADDMREVLLKSEQKAEEAREREAEAERQRKALEWQQRKEAIEQNMHKAGEVAAEVGKVLGAATVGAAAVAGAVAVGVLAVAGAALLAALRFDPILIAVMEDGRWVCLGAWWD